MSKRTVKEGKISSFPLIIYLPATMDLFHIGHLRAIRQCAKVGKVVIGLLDCPAYKKTVIPFKERKEILEALPEVEMVARQTSLDFSKNLRKIRPDFVASGDGFEEEEIKAVKNAKCKILNISYYKGQSTRKIKQKIRKTQNYD